MRFDELDRKMRHFETVHDLHVMSDVFMVARVDGRNFTRLTKEGDRFEAPFDERFRDAMLRALTHLMDCGFRTVYGFTESDEISILFHLRENSFERKLRKYDSVLAGEASAAFTSTVGIHGAFDCRISQLPTPRLVVDYFRWRQDDAARNALNAHAYWALRAEGETARTATEKLTNLSVAAKNELLFQRGINFNELPLWQRHGSGVWWETYEKSATNPKTGADVTATRRRLRVELELPRGDSYSELLHERVQEAAE